MMLCKHCRRTIVKRRADGFWIDPEATGDDDVWLETCDANDTFEARHEPGDMDDLRDATEERIKKIHPVDAAQRLDDHNLWCEAGTYLTCHEAEALAALLYSHGVDIERVGYLVIEGHGHEDNEDGFDLHAWEEEDRHG